MPGSQDCLKANHNWGYYKFGQYPYGRAWPNDRETKCFLDEERMQKVKAFPHSATPYEFPLEGIDVAEAVCRDMECQRKKGTLFEMLLGRCILGKLNETDNEMLRKTMFLMEYTLKNLGHQQGDFEGFLVKCSKAMSSIFRHEGKNEVNSQAWMTFNDFSLRFMQVCLSDDILLDPPFATPQKRWERYQTCRYPLQPCDFFCMLLFNSKGRFEWDVHYTEPTTRQGWSRRQMEDRLNQAACRWCVRIRACKGHSL